MSGWTLEFERKAVDLVHRLVGDGGTVDAWRALMAMLAPRLEGWARTNRLLARCRLANDDDARAVMVAVFERLASDRYANLRRFVAHQGPVLACPDELVSKVMRLNKLDEIERDRADDTIDTPFRAWLLRLVDFTAHDHARRRLGWSTDANKRALHSEASPLDTAAEPHASPAMTDRLTVAQLVDEIVAHIATFPADMRAALAMWLDDAPPAEIARTLALDDPERARTLVRAGQARLRDKFRGRSPVLFA